MVNEIQMPSITHSMFISNKIKPYNNRSTFEKYEMNSAQMSSSFQQPTTTTTSGNTVIRKRKIIVFDYQKQLKQEQENNQPTTSRSLVSKNISVIDSKLTISRNLAHSKYKTAVIDSKPPINFEEYMKNYRKSQ